MCKLFSRSSKPHVNFCFDRDDAVAAAAPAAEFQGCQADQGLVPPTRPPRFEGTQGGNRGGEAKRMAAEFMSSGPSVAKRDGRKQGACISKFYLRTHDRVNSSENRCLPTHFLWIHDKLLLEKHLWAGHL